MKKFLLKISLLVCLVYTGYGAQHFVLSSADAGSFTLRDQITNSSAGDTIYFDVVDTIRLTTGVITIDHNLTIFGTGFPIISGENSSRIFVLTNSATLHIEDLTMVNGTVGGSGYGGGAVYLSGGNVTMLRCNFYDNSCTGALNTWGGGALSIASGTVVAEDCHFEGNSVSGNAAGGAIHVQTSLTLERSTINNNSASGGGWKYGGAINAYGSVTLIYSTVSGNTISTSGNAYGAAIAKANPSGLINIQNSTLTENRILSGNDWGGALFLWGSGHIIKNSIVGDNFNASLQNSDIYANTTTTSGGYNIITSVVNGFNLVSTDIQSSPLLGALQNNGGYTPTHSINCSSPAYNAGDDSGAGSVDQRGVVSISHGQRDIGAFEFNGPLPTVSYSVNDVSCHGESDGSASISSASIGATYNWSTNTSGLSINNLSPGEYWVEEVTSDGCADRDTFDINEPTAILVSIAETDVTCFGDNDGAIDVSVSGGASGYTFDWDIDGTGDFDDMEDLNNLSGGNYVLNVQDAVGCLGSSGIVTITEPAQVGISAIPSGNQCYGVNDGVITVSGSGGRTPYMYNIDGGTFVSSGTFSNLAPDSYVVKVQDSSGCQSAGAQINFGVPSQITLTAIVTDNSGPGNGAIDLSVTGGNPGYTYLWDDNGNSATQDISGLVAGSYMVTVTDATLCEVTQTFSVGGSITGIQDDSISKIRVYPNPFSKQLFIDRGQFSVVDYRLFDVLGNQISQGYIEGNKVLLGDELSNGIYLLIISIEGLERSFRIVKE